MAQDKIYLTVDKDPKGRGLIAIMTQGHPNYDAYCTVLTLEIVRNMKAARAWFKRMQVERPWETRQ